MKRKSLSALALLAMVMSVILPVNLPAQDKPTLKHLEGSWAGALKIQGMELRIVMNIRFNESDSMIVTLDSPDQGVNGIPTSNVQVREDSIFIYCRKISGKFMGRITRDPATFDGTWSQSVLSLPLVLKHLEKKFTLNRPQEPKPPFPYQIREVIFPNRAAGLDLAGTLTLPENKEHAPAVILVSGSGPQNRDEEIMGHKPFWVLADFLTRNGIAVLRYDDRGCGKSGGVYKTASTLDFATDAEAAFDFLKTQPGIDTLRIGIAGHSEGGIIGPIVASRRPEIAFLVLMAGPGFTGEQILYQQSALISRAEGANEKSVEEGLALSKQIYSILKKTGDNEKASEKITRIYRSYDKKHSADSGYRKMSDEMISMQTETLTGNWFRCFLTLDPQEYLTRVTCPLLAIAGSLDLQVPPQENLRAIESAMILGGNVRYQIKELPGLNHLFQTAVTGSPSEYGKIEETFAPSALELILQWIRSNVE